MGTRFELLFMIPCLGFAALLAAWLVLAFTADLRSRAAFGVIGSLLAALLLGVLWQADHLPWLCEAGGVKAVPMIWVGAAVLNGFALASGRGRGKGVLATAIALGVISNVARCNRSRRLRTRDVLAHTTRRSSPPPYARGRRAGFDVVRRAMVTVTPDLERMPGTAPEAPFSAFTGRGAERRLR